MQAIHFLFVIFFSFCASLPNEAGDYDTHESRMAFLSDPLWIPRLGISYLHDRSIAHARAHAYAFTMHHEQFSAPFCFALADVLLGIYQMKQESQRAL
jgi:hypothetical protein